MTGDRSSSARPDLRERIAWRFFRVVNPLARRMIPAGVPTAAPNILLIVRGRRSGVERTTPVALLDFDGAFVRPGDLRSDGLGPKPQGGRRGDHNLFWWP